MLKLFWSAPFSAKIGVFAILAYAFVALFAPLLAPVQILSPPFEGQPPGQAQSSLAELSGGLVSGAAHSRLSPPICAKYSAVSRIEVRGIN